MKRERNPLGWQSERLDRDRGLLCQRISEREQGAESRSKRCCWRESRCQHLPKAADAARAELSQFKCAGLSLTGCCRFLVAKIAFFANYRKYCSIP